MFQSPKNVYTGSRQGSERRVQDGDEETNGSELRADRQPDCDLSDRTAGLDQPQPELPASLT